MFQPSWLSSSLLVKIVQEIVNMNARILGGHSPRHPIHNMFLPLVNLPPPPIPTEYCVWNPAAAALLLLLIVCWCWC